jgi:hypothetical protein
MILQSFLLHTDAPKPAPPLRAETLEPGQTRLTGLWPHRDLAAARKQVASYLAEVPAPDSQGSHDSHDFEVRCLLTGRTMPRSAWVETLRLRPTVQTTFEARHAITEGRLLARLFGMTQLGESDIVLIADPDVDVTDVYALLTAWATFRLGSAEPPQWDRPFPFGYGMLSFTDHDVGDADFWALCRDSLLSQHLRIAFDDRMQPPPPKVLIEAPDLVSLATLADPDVAFAIGATHTLRLRAAQRETALRLGADASSSPSATDAAGACDRLPLGPISGPRTEFFAYREAPRGPIDSGWRFGCLDPDHHHDADSLRIAPLAQIAAPHRGLERYLALSPGWVVTFEEGRFYVTAPGTDVSHPDTEPDSEMRPSGEPLA